MYFPEVFRSHGITVTSLTFGEAGAAFSELLPSEREFANSLRPLRRSSWVAGRVALRLALAYAGLDSSAGILPDTRGAPMLGPGVAGSISYKIDRAVAAVTREWRTIGIDIEAWAPEKGHIAPRVLSRSELLAAERITSQVAHWHYVIRTFSLKEAVFKALDPLLRRPFPPQEVGLRATEQGWEIVSVPFVHGRRPDLTLFTEQNDEWLVSLAALGYS